MKKQYYQIAFAVLFLCIVVGLFIYNLRNDLPGADDNASTVISQVAPNYKPWFEGIGLELSKRTERILFGLQMLGGVILFGVCLRYLQKSAKTVNHK